MADWLWYISIDSVKQYMQIAGLHGPLEHDNPDFVTAENDLGQISQEARLSDQPPSHSGALTYRMRWKINGKSQRLEMKVMPSTKDGSLPQLLSVRKK
jgi:hypothetical protein